MKKTALLLFFLFTAISYSQFDIRGGMGIDFISAPSYSDYINQSFAAPGNQLSSFNSAIVFSLEFAYHMQQSYHIAIEGAYLINSFTSTDITGKYEFAYTIIMPSVLNYYVIQGNGYNFKFGGGAGLRLLNADESIPATGITNKYSSTGFGFILRAEGNTSLGGNVYANVGADMCYDLIGDIEGSGKKLYNNVMKENVNMNSLSFGIKLGVSYYF